MEQRISLVTLGVSDPPRVRAFYQALGWANPDGNVWEVAHNPGWMISEDGTVRI
jgi:catechol 2,3-dioxygenase-like lactoylglutathione lyase family enzyme